MKPLLSALVLLALTPVVRADEVRVNDLYFVPGFEIKEDRTPCPVLIPELGKSPIWDIREFATKNGVPLKPGDILLWCPQSRRIFARAPEDTLDCIESLLTPTDNTRYRIDMNFAITRGAEPLLRFQCHAESGHKTDITIDDKTAIHASVSPLVGPDGTTIDTPISFDARADKYHVTLKGDFTLRDGDTTTLWTGEDPATKQTTTCTVKPSISSDSPSPRISDTEEKADLMWAIKERLE